MATNNRGGNRTSGQSNRETGNRGGNRSRSSGSNKSSRRSSSENRDRSSGGWVETAKDRPFAAAATIGGAVAAGVFLWSRRNQISDQISDLSDQLSEWREGFESDSDTDIGSAGGDSFMANSSRRGRKSQSEIAEEALTLKETGKKSKRGGDATIDEQTQVGAVAY